MSKDSSNYNDKESYLKWFKGQKTYTANRNARKLQQFCGWINKTPETLIEEYKNAEDKKVWQRERKNEIEGFYNHLIEKGFKINSARSTPIGVLTFFTRNCETVRDATKVFAPPQIPEDELVFTQEMLRKVYYYADLEGQTLLSLATCLGYSSADFLSLKCEKLSNLVQEAQDKNLEFIQFIGKSRAKTSVQPRSHLTPEAIHNLSDYLPVLAKKYGKVPKFLWCSEDPNQHITNEGLNKRIRRYLKEANVETYGKKVRFHLFRKFLYSSLQAKNRDIAKVITAKKVSASDLTYIQNLNAECLRVFKESYKQIALNGNLTGKTRAKQEEKIKRLDNAISNLSMDLQTSKEAFESLTRTVREKQTSIDTLNDKMENLENSLQNVKKQLAVSIELSELPEKIKKFTREQYLIEEFDEDTKKFLHAFREMKNYEKEHEDFRDSEEYKELSEKSGNYFMKWADKDFHSLEELLRLISKAYLT